MNQRAIYLSRTHLFIIAIMLLLLVTVIAIYWHGADIQVLALVPVDDTRPLANFWSG
jgi:membrane protein CcdC involved in cytochrome C biogenesis